MKKLFIFSLLFLLCACGAQTDSDRIIGTWKFKEGYQNGELVVSSDASKHSMLVNKLMKKYEAMPVFKSEDRQLMKETYLKSMQAFSKGGFIFKDKQYFEFTDGPTDTKKGIDYKINIKKKAIESTKDGKSYKVDCYYSFEGEELVMKKENLKFVLAKE